MRHRGTRERNILILLTNYAWIAGQKEAGAIASDFRRTDASLCVSARTVCAAAAGDGGYNCGARSRFWVPRSGEGTGAPHWCPSPLLIHLWVIQADRRRSSWVFAAR